MTSVKPVKVGVNPELMNYFEAINLHMKLHNQPYLLSTHSLHGISSSSALSIQVDDAKVEAQLVSEMTEQVRLIEQALFSFGEQNDPKKAELSEDVQKSFNGLWSENLTVIIKAIEFLKTICKDVHRYWPYLEGQMDRLVMACARVIGLMFTRYKSSLFVNEHNATRAPIINLLNSTAHLFHSIILKSPLLPSKISSETYSALFTSLMPYYLLSEEKFKNFDPLVESKIESFVTNMLSMSELNNLLLSLLRMSNAKMAEYNQDPSRHAEQMNILIKWMEQLSSYLSDAKVSNLNLDLILNEADMLIRAYPSSVLEISRDFRLLEAIREIVFLIVEYKGDPGIWDHMMMIDFGQGDSGLIKLINIALERNELFKFSSKPIMFVASLAKNDNENYVHRLLNDYKPIIPDGLRLSEQEMDPEDDPDQELFMFMHFLNSLASTSEMVQGQLCLDYLNQNFDDLVSKFAKSLEPQMDLLIQACTRQYYLFTTLYYPPNVGLASCQSLQMLHSTTSLLKRIFTSTISLSSATSQTMSRLVLLIFSMRLSWTSNFSVEGLTELESSILANDSLDKSALICICIQIQRNFFKLPPNNFGEIQRFGRQMMTELTIPLQFVTSSMLSELYDLNAIMYEINEYVINSNGQALKDISRFAKNSSEPIEESMSPIEKLIYFIVRQRRFFIYNNLKSIHTNQISGPLQHFIHEIITDFDSKPNYAVASSSSSSSQIDEMEEQRRQFSLMPINLTDKLEEIQTKILPEFRQPKHFLHNVIWFAAKLGEMINFYDLVAHYPMLLFTTIDALTEACTMAIVHFKNFTLNPNNYFNSYQGDQSDLDCIYSRIGELLLRMYGNSDSVGHEYVTVIRLKDLIKTNIAMVLTHARRPKEHLAPHFRWIWDVQYALTNQMKPYDLLLLSVDLFNGFINELVNGDSVIRSMQTNYLLAHVLTSMFDISCGQMFLYPTAIYTPSMPKDKFDVASFLKKVDVLFECYPVSFLEAERDYKILVLIRRVLQKLYEHHGFLIREFWGAALQSEIDRSPVYSYFEQLIAKNGQIERAKYGESGLYESFAVAPVENPIGFQEKPIHNVKPTSNDSPKKELGPADPFTDMFEF